MSQKISKFIKILSVDDSGVLTVVQNGQNFQISQEDYFKQFGVTGSMAQAGAATATPVLEIDGTVNKIRGIEDGPGILSSLSPENGIAIKHNFAVDAVGAPIFLNPTAAQPTFASILAGSGISVAVSGDQVLISSSTNPTSTSTVLVNQESDFPAAVGGVITLADATDYFMTQSITTANRFVLGSNSQLRAAGSVITALTYTGVDAMFTGNDIGFVFSSISLQFPTGSLFNVTSTTGVGAGFLFADNILWQGGAIGDLSVGSTSIVDGAIVLTAGGLNLTADTMGLLGFTNMIWVQLAGKCIDYGTCVVDASNLTSIQVTYVTGVSFLSGLPASGNVPVGSIALVRAVRFSGLGTPLDGITPQDDRWDFQSNDVIQDSRTDGLLSFNDNATATVISASSTDGSNAVLVAGVWDIEGESMMDGTATGRLTLAGSKPARLPIDASISMLTAGGGDKQIAAYIVIDGVVDVSTRQTATVSSTKSAAITLHWQKTFQIADYVEVYVENQDNTENVIVTDATLRVN